MQYLYNTENVIYVYIYIEILSEKAITINKHVLDMALEGNYVALPIPLWWHLLVCIAKRLQKIDAPFNLQRGQH